MRLPVVFIVLFTVLVTSCQKELNEEGAPGLLKIRFEPLVDGAQLRMNSEYRNEFNEDFTVSTFKLYLSDLRITDKQGRAYRDPGYYLIDAADAGTREIVVTPLVREMGSISFLLGVDSTRNVSGAQTGALDPAKGMFWTWNTGYIMAKLEGISSVAATPNNEFTYHIGGFSGVNSVLQRVELPLSAADSATIPDDGQLMVIVGMEIKKWFKGANDLPISVNAFVHSPGELARRYADNYSAMFSIQSVNAE